MRRNIGKVLVLAVVIGAVISPRPRAQQNRPTAPAPRAAASPPAPNAAPAPPAPDPAKAARMRQLLQLWEGQSTKLKTLIVKIERVDHSPAWGDEEYEGDAIFKSPNLAWLNFKKWEENNGGKRLVPHEQIRCTGTEVWQYKTDTQQVFIYPLEKKDQRHALEEGPLPFLFNMRAADAEKRYHMELRGEDDKAYVIKVIPRLEIDRESFLQAYIQLDRKFLLPSRIFLLAPDGKSTKDFKIRSSEANPPRKISDAYFEGEIPPKPWTVVRNPDAEGRPQPQPAGPGMQRAPARRSQPALRPGTPAGRQ
jgi:TIGR03009 family protein